MTTAYLSLGANLGNPRDAVHQAINRLNSHEAIIVTRRARLYCTAPVGPVVQDDFVNTAIEIETALSAVDLLSVCKSIERDLGRVIGAHWGPRLIDIDLLLFGESSIWTDGLNVPHPEMWKRAFVLAPLSDIRPDLRSPSGEPIEILRDLLSREQRVTRLDNGAG